MAGFQITEVIAVGPGWNRVRLSDGNIYTIEGNYNWRSNNPGNIEYGPFAESMGAIGSGAVPEGRERGFAIFPTYEEGRRAKESLLFEGSAYLNTQRGGYEKGSIGAAIHKYAPPEENDTEGYIRAITSALGVTPNAKLSDLSGSQRATMLDTMERVEGWKIGDIKTADGVRLPPAEIPNVVGSLLDVQRPVNAPLAARDGAPRPLAYTDPRTGQLYQGVEPPQPAMRQGLIDNLKEGPRQRVRLPDITPSSEPQTGAAPSSILSRPATNDIGSMPAQSEIASLLAAHRPTGAAATVRAADTGLSQRLNVTPVLAAGNEDIYSYHIPDITLASLDGGLGSLTPDFLKRQQPADAMSSARQAPSSARSAQELAQIYGDGGPTRPPSSIVGQEAAIRALDARPAPGQSGMVGQEAIRSIAQPAKAAEPMTLLASNTPGFYRIGGMDGGAGSVAMPRDVRPNVTIPTNVPTPGTGGMNSILSMPSFDDFQSRMDIAPKAQYPNEIRSIADMETTQRKGLSQPLGAGQTGSFAAQDAVPQFKTVMREQKVENPEYKVWQSNELSKAQSIPVGDRAFSVSRDSKDAVLAGEAFAATKMPEQWITRQVPVQVPIAAPRRQSAPAQQPLTPIDMSLTRKAPATKQPSSILDMVGNHFMNNTLLGRVIGSVQGAGGNRVAPQPSQPIGSILGFAGNGGAMIQGKNGVMNSITQASDAWKSITGQQDGYTRISDSSFADASGGVYYDRHIK